MLTTERGICLNLNESEYKITIEGFTYYFSSRIYLEKFVSKVREFIALETAKIYVKYKIKLNLELYFMIAFYSKIEKRGFRIVDESNKKEITKSCGFLNQLISY